MRIATTYQSAIIVDRIIDAPREVIWREWSDAGRLRRWIGAKGYAAGYLENDFRLGGRLTYMLRSPEGREIWHMGHYREIYRPERLVYTEHFTDKSGRIVPGAYYGLPEGLPMETVVTVMLDEYPAGGGNKTWMTLKHSNFSEVPEHDQDLIRRGWGEALEKMEHEAE